MLPSRAPAPQWPIAAFFQILQAPGEPLGQPLHLVVDGGPGAGVPLVLDHQRVDHGLGERGVASTARSMAAWASFGGLPGLDSASIRTRQRMRMSRSSSYSGSPRMVLSHCFTAAAVTLPRSLAASAGRPSSPPPEYEYSSTNSSNSQAALSWAPWSFSMAACSEANRRDDQPRRVPPPLLVLRAGVTVIPSSRSRNEAKPE